MVAVEWRWQGETGAPSVGLRCCGVGWRTLSGRGGEAKEAGRDRGVKRHVVVARKVKASRTATGGNSASLNRDMMNFWA